MTVSPQYQPSGGTASEIAASVEHGVAAGALAPGDPLPSVRALAAALDVSPTTVAAALSELRRRGVVVSRPRSGTRIGERPPLRPRGSPVAPPGFRDLASGSPDRALLPDVEAVLRDLPAPHRLYGEPPVLEELAAVAGPNVCVVNGALDGIERVLAAHLSPGDAVVVEDPGWPGVIDLVRALGLRVAGARVDSRGMVPEELERALRAGARAVVLTPRGQNPFGAAHDAARAAELRALLPEDVLLVEDDHLGPVAGVDWHSAAGSTARFATVQSVSKWLGPDLRVAIVTGDELTLARVAGAPSPRPGRGRGGARRRGPGAGPGGGQGERAAADRAAGGGDRRQGPARRVHLPPRSHARRARGGRHRGARRQRSQRVGAGARRGRGRPRAARRADLDRARRRVPAGDAAGRADHDRDGEAGRGSGDRRRDRRRRPPAAPHARRVGSIP